jgi:hypothetical protein
MSDDNDDTNKAANLYRAADVLNNQKGGKYRAGRKRKQPAKKPLPEGWRPAQGNKGRGAPGFCPTAAERTLVAILSSGFLDQPDICRVIGAQRGQKPIGISTLRKCFAREISGGRAHVKATAVRGFYEALKAREAWAISMAMRNFYNWDKPGSTGLNFNLPGKDGKPEMMRIEFVSPRPRPDLEAELKDVSPAPPSPQPSGPVDYKQARLPAPPERELTPLGWIERGKPFDWMR